MKIQKKLNIVLTILIVVLVSLISFGGIYYKNKNAYSNKLPNYILGADLTGYRRVILNPENTNDSSTQDENDTTNETANTSDSNNTENTNDANESTNSIDNSSNYAKSAEIIRARLKALGIENYTVSCNKNTGKIEMNLPEDDRTDVILSDIVETGKFKITDSDTGDVLIDNSDVRSASLTEQTSSSSSYEVLNINFTTKGANKFKNITEKYQNNVSESSNENSSNDENSSSDNESSSNKKVKISIDDSELLSTTFSEIVDNGQLSLTMGYSSSMTDEQKNSAKNLCAIIENDSLPVEYKVEENSYVAPEMDANQIKAMICIEGAIALILALYMIIKFRIQGLMQTIISIGYIAILLIVIRLANVSITTAGICAVLVSYITSYIYGYMLLKNIYGKKDLSKKEISKLLKKISQKYCLVLIPILIITIIYCLTKWTSLYSFGMIMFWGIIISIIYNILLSKFLIRTNIEEKW